MVEYRISRTIYECLKMGYFKGKTCFFVLVGVKSMENEIKIKKSITFGEIALALANDYDSIFVIDSDDNSYVEYLAEGDNKELVRRASGKDFYKDVVRDCREQVYPEDQENFLNAFKKENIEEVLKNGKSFALNYRLMINNQPLYYFLKTIRGTDDKVIIGVQNVDDQVRDKIRAEMQIKTYMHISGALASRYEAIYYINVENSAYTQYSASDEYAKLGTTRQGEDFFGDAADDIRKYIHKDDMKRVLSELKRENLLKHLKESGTVTLTYRQQLGDRTQYVTSVIVQPRNHPNHIVMGVMNVDAQIKREQDMLAENRVFNEMAMALGSRYEVIYRVNIKTDEYSEYSASAKYTRLEVGVTGKDFFADTHKNMKKDIYPEDFPMMEQAMNKDILLANLKEEGKVYLNYRLMLEGRPQYVTLIVLKPKNDSEHIIVAVENIDAAKRREIEFEKAIGSAIDLANKDALTSVKNKHAYANSEQKLDLAIEAKEDVEFAIVVCDINGLKKVNDQQGHSVGDEYIKSACRIICNIFDHSPVFRIGGDEFVIILRGSDYENRMELIAELGMKVAENKRAGLVTLAYGISDFDAKNDLRVQDVFERADELMYRNKRRFKGEIPDEEVSSGGSEQYIKFYELYEQLVSAMTEIGGADIPRIEQLLIEISTMFRLSKGITRVYKNPQEEQDGSGETLCCFDTGKEGEAILSRRVATSVLSSATITVYMSPDEKPLTDSERWKVELVMRTVLSFVSRNRLKNIVEELAYLDDNGYPNLRSLIKYINENTETGAFVNKAAFRYNLRHFSLVNQEFGRDTGDIIMKKHFDTLKERIGKEGFLARLGGDNFVGICTMDKVKEIADYLLEAPIAISEGRVINIPTSAGIFCIPDDYIVRNPSDIMGKIITAYRVAQTGGKDHIVYFDKSLYERKEKSMRVQQLFSDALKDGEFKPLYQPKVNIISGEIVGAEALCRWFRGSEVIVPDEFIPMLEETSDICRLDLYMLEHVCRDIRRWIDEGKDAVRVSVNFSRKNILNAALPDTIAEIVDHYNVPHKYIEIELTETTTDVEFSDLKRIARGLHDKGFYTSVDDFGIGFSSLNLIRDIPWNTVKIDRSFLPIEEDDESSVRAIMFRSVVRMTKKLGLECIAEGVETERQLQILCENDCEVAQGYYFDRPLVVEEFEKRLLMKKYTV